tara:strand:- start:239 stop:466 length:228 start_codon:yes stop_codon:yes gene_type:complete
LLSLNDSSSISLFKEHTLVLLGTRLGENICPTNPSSRPEAGGKTLGEYTLSHKQSTISLHAHLISSPITSNQLAP